jgi:hypothetical protein
VSVRQRLAALFMPLLIVGACFHPPSNGPKSGAGSAMSSATLIGASSSSTSGIGSSGTSAFSSTGFITTTSSTSFTVGSNGGLSSTSTTGSSTSGFTSTSGSSSGSTTGSVVTALPICAACVTNDQCRSGFCNAASGAVPYCDSSECVVDPSICGPYGCSSATDTCGCLTMAGSGCIGVSAVIVSALGDSGEGGDECGGSGIQSVTDCGGTHQVCTQGESCGEYNAAAGGTYFACGCTPSSGESCMDSCGEANGGDGGSGLTVCDSVTLQCRQPRDLEPVFVYATSIGDSCAPGYGVIEGDAGGIPTCSQPCNVDLDCAANFTFCANGPVNAQALPDGGDLASQHSGHCDYNFCHPSGGGTDVGFYSPCPIGSSVTEEGICQPVPDGTGGYYGICLRNGPQDAGSACGGLLGPRSDSCVAGDVCAVSNEPSNPCSPQQTSYCLPVCNGNAPDAGPFFTAYCPFPAEMCHLYPADPSRNPLQAGVCY